MKVTSILLSLKLPASGADKQNLIWEGKITVTFRTVLKIHFTVLVSKLYQVVVY